MSKERTTKDKVEYIASKFSENPGHFAATILQMYWDMEKERDQYKAENEKLKEEVEHLKGIIQDEEDWKLLKLEEEWL